MSVSGSVLGELALQTRQMNGVLVNESGDIVWGILRY